MQQNEPYLKLILYFVIIISNLASAGFFYAFCI
uniref:Uncharacterized protein n=1 Tax=Siphoviridae sp. ct5lU19 TaxID=2827780 RepID=A0A8S5SB77_9CAUD|nr:MAG TPA: hypothetical protein [Siphoviridae sp. ct5lU19]